MLYTLNPWQELERIQRQINSLFRRSEHDEFASRSSFPLMNIYDAKDDLLVTVELPGMSRDQVSITAGDGLLTIKGKRPDNAPGKNYTAVRQERSVGEFEKSVRIPNTVLQDRIGATFKNGVLAITLPKAEEAKPKQITIEVT
ncbi:MAG: Hsp20/alpha crystallin family protein [Chitinispirillaceae bacterium]|nr:Hsp20/alpha crystallin family protein [Chitinispirillaceae bacterium]